MMKSISSWCGGEDNGTLLGEQLRQAQVAGIAQPVSEICHDPRFERSLVVVHLFPHACSSGGQENAGRKLQHNRQTIHGRQTSKGRRTSGRHKFHQETIQPGWADVTIVNAKWQQFVAPNPTNHERSPETFGGLRWLAD